VKVLHIYRTYFPDTQGGGEEVIRQVCLNTRPLGVESRVFSLSPDPSAEPLLRPEGQVHQVKNHLEIASCGISFSCRTLFREQAAWADILHYHFPWPYGDVLHLTNPAVTSKPVVISYHSDVVRQKALYFCYRPLMQLFLRQVDRIVATSPNYVESSPLLQRYRHKTRVIPIGVDEARLPDPSPRLIQQYQQQFGHDFVFFIGVFRYYKGLQFLLEAAKQVTTPIVIAGSGPEEANLRAFARQHKLDHVHFVGRIDDEHKMALLAASKALVFPSHLPSESFGIALLEASMMARPMISCEIGTGTSWVNLHRETGLVIPPANPDALAQAISTLVGDPVLCKRYGDAARQRYEQCFTGEVMGRQYADLYRSLMNDTEGLE
jgi:O-antigen biosynthesis rhamnosyltransferase